MWITFIFFGVSDFATFESFRRGLETGYGGVWNFFPFLVPMLIVAGVVYLVVSRMRRRGSDFDRGEMAWAALTVSAASAATGFFNDVFLFGVFGLSFVVRTLLSVFLQFPLVYICLSAACVVASGVGARK